MTSRTPKSSHSRLYTALRGHLARGFDFGGVVLPMLPETAGRVISLANDPNAEVRDLRALIHRDDALAASVLRFANSAAYSTGEEITSLQQAIMRLGMTTISGIAIAACLDGNSFKSSSYDALRRRILTHALVCAGFARELARRKRRNLEVLFLCGLLHSIGKPVLLRVISDLQRKLRGFLNEGEVVLLLDEFHCSAGATVAKTWKLPGYLQIVTACYRTPDEAPDFAKETELTAFAARLASWAAHSIPPDVKSVREFEDWNQLQFDETAMEELIEHGRCLRKSTMVSLV